MEGIGLLEQSEEESETDECLPILSRDCHVCESNIQRGVYFLFF